MASFVLLAPPRAGADLEDAVLVEDGFSWLAFLFAPVWLAFHRLWFEAAAVLLAMVGLGLIGALLGSDAAGSALSLLLAFFVGLEGQALRIAGLLRRGWIERGVVDAGSAGEAEIRLADDADDARPAEIYDDPAPPPPAASPVRPRASGPTLGLLSYPARG